MSALSLKSTNSLPQYFSAITNFSSQSKVVEQNSVNLKVSEDKLIEIIYSLIEFIDSNKGMFLSYNAELAQEAFSINENLINEISKSIEQSSNKDLVDISKPLFKKLNIINELLQAITEDIDIDETSPEFLNFTDDLMDNSIKSGLSSTL